MVAISTIVPAAQLCHTRRGDDYSKLAPTSSTSGSNVDPDPMAFGSVSLSVC